MLSWSRFSAGIYDRFMAPTEEACLAQWRRELLAHAHGKVLEIGAGTGVNAQYYGDRVTHLHLSEPNDDMRRVLGEKVRELPRLEIVDWPAERLRAENATYDVVAGTLVLCTVTDLEAALQEVRRVLRPGGQFLFLEHVAAHDDTSRLRWQRRVEPIWKPVAGGCHLTRDTEQAIVHAGFEIVRIERESMRKAISLIRPTIRGIARAPAHI